MLRRRQNHRRDHRLFDFGDAAGVRQLRRAVDFVQLAIGRRHPVKHPRSRRHEVHVELALQALLDDLHVEQSQESAAEPESQRRRGLRLEKEGGVVQSQLFEGVAELGVLMAFHGIQPREHHRLQLLEPWKRDLRRPVGFGNGVADLRVANPLDIRHDEAHFARRKLPDGLGFRREDAHLLGFVILPLRHEPDLRSGFQGPVDNPHDNHDAAIGVVPRVEDQRLQRRLLVARRRRQPVDHRLQHIGDADAFFRAGQDGMRAVESDDLFDLPARFFGLRAGQVDLVNHRNDLEVVLNREIGVGQRLRFDALRRVDQQHGAFARRKRPGHFVGKVDMARRIDEVEDVGLPVSGRVVEAHRVRLDGNTAFTLEIHRIQHLRFHLARLERAGELEKTIGKRRFPVIDVGDDGEISDALGIHSIGFRLQTPGFGSRLLVQAGVRTVIVHGRSRSLKPGVRSLITSGRGECSVEGRPDRCIRRGGG